jgi:hypothetical protein
VSTKTGIGISTGWVSFVWTHVSARLLGNVSYEETDLVPDLVEIFYNRTAIDSETPFLICQSLFATLHAVSAIDSNNKEALNYKNYY